jgi:hypothetical protein
VKACRVRRKVVSLTLGLDTRLRWVAQFTPPAALHLGKNPLPIEEEARWAQSRSGCVRRESLPAGNGTPAHSLVMYLLPPPSGPLLWWFYDVFYLSFIVLLSFLSLPLYLSFSFSPPFILLCISFRVSLYVLSFLPPLLYLYSILAIYFFLSVSVLPFLPCYLVSFFVGWWCTDATTFVSTTPAWRNFAAFLLIILRVSFIFARGFVWVWNLVADTERGTQAEGVWE